MQAGFPDALSWIDASCLVRLRTNYSNPLALRARPRTSRALARARGATELVRLRTELDHERASTADKVALLERIGLGEKDKGGAAVADGFAAQAQRDALGGARDQDALRGPQLQRAGDGRERDLQVEPDVHEEIRRTFRGLRAD